MSGVQASLVVDNDQPAKIETVSQRIKSLLDEARGLARDAILSLQYDMAKLEERAAEIEDGGPVFPAGVREEARQLQEYLEGSAQRISKLMQ